MTDNFVFVSRQTLNRLPQYLNYLKELDPNENISATKIAEALMLNHVVVRKDLASISSSGRPRVGYHAGCLIHELETYLGYQGSDDAIIVGAGRLGKALLSHEGFAQYGFHVLAAFDINDDALATPDPSNPSKPLLPLCELDRFCKESNVSIGIITVPDKSAQDVANHLIDCGILAIWNFTSVRLITPPHILVQNENMAASLAALSKHLSENIHIR